MEVFAKFRNLIVYSVLQHAESRIHATERGPFNFVSRRVLVRPILQRNLIVRFIVSQREIIRICRAIGVGRANPRGWLDGHRRGTTKMKFRLAFIAPRRFDCADFIERWVYYRRNKLQQRMRERIVRRESTPPTSRRCHCTSKCHGDESGARGERGSNHTALLIST